MEEKIDISNDELVRIAKHQTTIRKERILKAVEAGHAWHPDVTVSELEQIGKSILEKSENNDD